MKTTFTIVRFFHIKKKRSMKKLSSIHLGEKAKIALMAVGFLGFVMLLSYLYWFA